jgi:hypothetical protein
MTGRVCLVLVLSFALAACDEFVGPPPAPSASSRAAASGEALQTTADAGPARTTTDADPLLADAMATATAYTKMCRMTVDLSDEIVSDACRPRGAERDALVASHRALVAHRDQNPDALRGAAATFAEEATLFGSWVEEATRSPLKEYAFTTGQIRALNGLDATGATRGTLALYQKLARAWNAYRPAASVAVDPVRTYLQGGYNERPIETLSSWYYQGVDQKGVKKGGTLQWLRCIDGPCLLGY